MGIRKARIEIELQSDLCSGSGYSYAGVVDNDVCYDDQGLPYIPARRIKGCMREVLESLLYVKYPNEADKLFGKSGASDYKDRKENRILRIGNAYPAHYEHLSACLAGLIGRSEGRGSYEISVQDVLERYTHVVGQTRMKNGVAKDNSLRYTRVVNRFDPIKEGENIRFYADIDFDEAVSGEVEDILAAMRHIGLMRNRGYGAVRCRLLGEREEVNGRPLYLIREEGDTCRIYFAVSNTEPLLLCGQDDAATEDYISGQSVLGAMASRYLRGGNSADSEEFRDLFLNGQTVFSNLYPYDGERIYEPAPAYLCKLKKTKEYVYNLAAMSERRSDGNLPKMMKDTYVTVVRGDGADEVTEYETEKDILYHNRHQHEEIGTELLLYSAEVLKPGQRFAGSITVPKKYRELMIRLLEDGEIHFGKSKSAQYGTCKLVEAKKLNTAEPAPSVIDPGDAVLVTFLSDGAFLNDRAEYTTQLSDVKKIVCGEVNLRWEDDAEHLSCLQTKQITGYQGVWNLRRNPIPAIKAGSFFVIKAVEEFRTGVYTVGERNLEGHGVIRIEKVSDYLHKDLTKGKRPEKGPKMVTDEVRSMLVPILAEKWLEWKIIGHWGGKDTFANGESNAAVGRIKLMLMESLQSSRDVEAQQKDFEKRIGSIKTEQTRKQGMELVKEAQAFTVLSADFQDILGNLGIDEGRMKRALGKLWGDYIMAIITHRKYAGKGGESK